MEAAITREGIISNICLLINLTHELLSDLNIDVDSYETLKEIKAEEIVKGNLVVIYNFLQIISEL